MSSATTFSKNLECIPVAPTLPISSLSTKRQHEIEEYYWNLPSDYDSESQLSIVGMMIDFAEVIYDNNILTIKLSRIDK